MKNLNSNKNQIIDFKLTNIINDEVDQCKRQHTLIIILRATLCDVGAGITASRLVAHLDAGSFEGLEYQYPLLFNYVFKLLFNDGCMSILAYIKPLNSDFIRKKYKLSPEFCDGVITPVIARHAVAIFINKGKPINM